ncbi:uncharacterized protein [Cardiocondyla obscurior]|uniref:uncharacterized protein n=1 Tax=Cardiocondyla obscurior TaxID=286306 RepID=UPI0039658472
MDAKQTCTKLCQFCLKKISEDTQIYLSHLKSHHPFEMSYNCIFSNCYRKFHKFFTLEKHILQCIFRNNEEQSVSNKIIHDTQFIEDIQCTKKYTQNVSVNNISLNKDFSKLDSIQNCILKYIATLHNKPNVPRIIVQEFVEELQEVIQNVSKHIHDRLKKDLPHKFHNVLEKCCNISILEDVQTEYKRFKYLKKSEFYIQSESFFIGDVFDDKKSGQKTILTIKKCEGLMVPTRKILKSLFDIPGFYDKILNIISIDNSLVYSNKVYTNFCDGTIWKIIKQFYGNKLVVPIFLYYDNFETGNPLGTAAGIHKVGALYGSIATLPPQYASMLDNIFLIEFIYSSDRTHFGNVKCFHKVIEEIKYLSNTGIVIRNINDKEITIYFVVVGLLGDNLGLNSLLGFNESYVSEYFCRICRASKSVTCCAKFEDVNLLRTSENYAQDVIFHMV